MSGVDEFELQPLGEEEEVVDALPVLAEVREVEYVARARLGAVQAAAVAATSFAAGAATLMLARRLGARKLAAAGGEVVRRPDPFTRPWGAGETRTYVVHVRVIGR
jgi:hypothetical protein